MLLILSIAYFGWEVWAILGVPSLSIPFGDSKIIEISSDLVANGIDPYSHKITGISQMNYPPLWINISDFFNLIKYPNNIIFVIILIFFYVVIYVDIINDTKSYLPIIFFFSGSSLLLIERGNNDLLIIFLVYLLSKNLKILTSFFYLFSVILKIYPMVLLPFILLKNKYRFFVLIPLIIYFYVIKDQLFILLNNTPKSSSTSYGTNSISILFERYLSINLNFLIISLCFILVSTSIYFYLNKKNYLNSSSEKFENLFFCGSSILCFSFLVTSNWDYRLSFLILCIPHMLSQNKIILKSFIISSIISMHYSLLHIAIGKLGSSINLISKVILFLILLTFTYDIILKEIKKNIG